MSIISNISNHLHYHIFNIIVLISHFLYYKFSNYLFDKNIYLPYNIIKYSDIIIILFIKYKLHIHKYIVLNIIVQNLTNNNKKKF